MTAFKERMYLRSFQEISKILSSTLSVDEVLDHIVRQITEVMNLKGATIRLVNPKTNRLELAAAHGLSEKYLKKGPVDLDKSVTEALSGRPVAIFDAVNDSRMQYPEEAKEEGIATLVAIPMVAKGKVIGVMRLVTAEAREFTMEEVDFACAVAELGAQAISNAKMYENRTKELNFLKGLLEVSKAVNSALDVKKVLHLLVKTVTTALDIKGAGVRLLDEKRQQMELVASYGLSERYITKGPVGTDKSITDAMMGKAVSIYDVDQDPRATYRQGVGGRRHQVHPVGAHQPQGQRHRGHAHLYQRTPGVQRRRDHLYLLPGGAGGPGHGKRPPLPEAQGRIRGVDGRHVSFYRFYPVLLGQPDGARPDRARKVLQGPPQFRRHCQGSSCRTCRRPASPVRRSRGGQAPGQRLPAGPPFPPRKRREPASIAPLPPPFHPQEKRCPTTTKKTTWRGLTKSASTAPISMITS